MTWEVGQTVYVVGTDSRRRNPHYVVISKVGRKWAECMHIERGWQAGRFDINTGAFDGKGYSSPARAWLSKEEYDADTERRSAWSDLQQKFRNCWGGPGDHLTTERIRTIYTELFPDG